jgi:hypothetical protein
MLTGRYVDLVNKHPAQVAPVTGVNPMSHEWKMVYDTATQYEHILAGDISKQEATTLMIMRDAFIVHISTFYMLNEHEEEILKHGLAGLHGYYFECSGYIYFSFKGHSSGHFLTTLYNSFCTWFLHKVAYEHLVINDELRFEDNVSLRVLGDDSFGTVSDEVADMYNMVSIGAFCNEFMGIKYTSGVDKNAELKPFVERYEVMFLGRSFKMKGELMVGPLREEAINDLIIWSLHVPGMTTEEIDAVRIDQAMREAALYGRQYYTALKSKIEQTMSKRTDHAPKILPYKHMWRQITSNWYKNDYDGRYEPIPKRKVASN